MEILERGRYHPASKDAGQEPGDWSWYETGTECDNGCIDAVIVPADALAAKDARIAMLEAAVVAMTDDGWLMCGVEGMSQAQETCYAAYLTIVPKE